MRGHPISPHFFQPGALKRSAPPWKKHHPTINFPLSFQYWPQTWDKYHIDLNHCFHWFHWFHWFHPQSPLSQQPHLNSFWTNFELFKKRRPQRFWKFKFESFFKLLSPSHKPSSSLSYIYFQTLLRRLTHLPLYLKIQEPKNHTEEGSLSESRVVAPIASLNLSYNSLYGKRKFKN